MTKLSLLFCGFAVILVTSILIMIKLTINLVPSLETNQKTSMNVASSQPTATTTNTKNRTITSESFFYDLIGASNTQPEPSINGNIDDNDDTNHTENPSEPTITDNTQNTLDSTESDDSDESDTTQDNHPEATTITGVSREDHLDDLSIHSNKRNVLNFTIDGGIYHSLEEITQKIIELEKKGFNAYFLNTMLNNKKAYLLRIGLFDNQKEALNIAFKLNKEGVKSEVLPMVQ